MLMMWIYPSEGRVTASHQEEHPKRSEARSKLLCHAMSAFLCHFCIICMLKCGASRVLLGSPGPNLNMAAYDHGENWGRMPRPSQYGTMDRALGQTKPKLPRAPGMNFVIKRVKLQKHVGVHHVIVILPGWGFGTTKRPGALFRSLMSLLDALPTLKSPRPHLSR